MNKDLADLLAAIDAASSTGRRARNNALLAVHARVLATFAKGTRERAILCAALQDGYDTLEPR